LGLTAFGPAIDIAFWYVIIVFSFSADRSF